MRHPGPAQVSRWPSGPRRSTATDSSRPSSRSGTRTAAARSTRTRSASGAWAAQTATPPRMIAAFSAAISASVAPSTAWWSRSMRAITTASGVPTVVASSRPPRPTSSTATSTASRAKWSSPSAVVVSNIVASSLATSVPSASTPSTTASSAIGSPSTRMRSRNDTRCGEV